MDSITIELDLPPKELHPNGGKAHNVHKIARLTKSAHEYAWLTTLAELNRRRFLCAGYVLDYEVWRASRVKPDDDNTIAWFKAYRDGIAAALGVDDRRFRNGELVEHTNSHEPRVRITVREAKQ